MQKVSGIGGVFLTARDPEMLGKWYETHLGVPVPPSTYEDPEWLQEAGPTVFAFMQSNSDHFKGSGKSCSINFRVKNLEQMIVQLESASIKVERDPEVYPNGVFASLTDPEGNLIQLWQPSAS